MHADLPDDTERQHRTGGWFQFRLRSLLGLMIVLAVAFGWLADRQRLEGVLRAEQALTREKELLIEALRASQDEPVEPQLNRMLDLFSQQPTRKQSPVDETHVQPLDGYLADVSEGDAPPVHLGTVRNEDPMVPLRRVYTDLWPKDKTSVPTLIRLLDDPDAQQRARAACTLARMGFFAKAALPALLRRLEDDDFEARWHGVWALGRIAQAKANPEVITKLREEMNDDHSPLPAFVAATLRQLDPQIDLAPRLVELLDHSDGDTRRRAAELLTEIGTENPEANELPAASIRRLTKLFEDPDRRVSMAAMKAVFELAPPEDAHAALIEVVKRSRDGDDEVWRYAARLWGCLDQQINAARREGNGKR